jgi:hypothetical protein
LIQTISSTNGFLFLSFSLSFPHASPTNGPPSNGHQWKVCPFCGQDKQQSNDKVRGIFWFETKQGKQTKSGFLI